MKKNKFLTQTEEEKLDQFVKQNSSVVPEESPYLFQKIKSKIDLSENQKNWIFPFVFLKIPRRAFAGVMAVFFTGLIVYFFAFQKQERNEFVDVEFEIQEDIFFDAFKLSNDFEYEEGQEWLMLAESVSKSPSVISPHRFSPLDIFDNGYSEEKFNQVLQVVLDIYSPIIESLGGELKILSDWSDGAVNMWAFRLGDEYWLEIPGGMSRYHLIIEEAFVLSICHELGHMLGGVPQQGLISLEGQADYWATFDCVSKLLPEITPNQALDVSDEVKGICKHFENESIQLCHRAFQGALSLTSYYAEVEGSLYPQFSTPSSDVVYKTLNTHPSAQCRLDTFYAGFLKLSRPLCWYKPSTY